MRARADRHPATWDKRYITLAPNATLLGLAFHLFDPENHLGRGEDIGITLALVPTRHPASRLAAGIFLAAPPSPTALPPAATCSSARLGHRRQGTRRPRLAHADELPRRRARDLAPRRAPPAPSRCCATPPLTRASGSSSACRWGLWRAWRSLWPAWSRRPRDRGGPRRHRLHGVAGEKPAVISALIKYCLDRAHARLRERRLRHPWRAGASATAR